MPDLIHIIEERDQLRHALQILLDSESAREQDKWRRELPVTKDWVEKYALGLSKSTDWLLWVGENPHHKDWPVINISAGSNSVCVTFKNRGQFLDLISGLDILGELRKEKCVE